MLFNPGNLPYWIFLGMGVLLFLLVIVAGGGNDELDVDTDVDVDVDGDLDTDTDADFDFSLSQVLGWLGIGRAPLILLLATDFSLWGVLGWMLNVWVGSIVGQLPNHFLVGGVVLLGSMAISLFIGGLIARPIGKVFAEFGEDTSGDRLIGCIGTVSSALIPPHHTGKIGQVDVIDPARNRVGISATLPEWATVLPRRGEKVIVIDRELRSYIVIAKDSLDRDRWFANSSNHKNSK